ncbi:hypothetical protein [Escherichia coli]
MLFTSFSGSLVSRISGAVQNYYHEYGGNDTCPLCTKHIDD